jgi:hypothetical protein
MKGLACSSLSPSRLLRAAAQLQNRAAVRCADEDGFCSFRGTATVRYGADGNYATKTFTNGTRCANDVFGDPAFGRVKTCDYSQ